MNAESTAKSTLEVATEIVNELDPKKFPLFFRVPVQVRVNAVKTMIELDRIGENANIAAIARRCGAGHCLRLELYKIADAIGIRRARKYKRKANGVRLTPEADVAQVAPGLQCNYVVFANPGGAN